MDKKKTIDKPQEVNYIVTYRDEHYCTYFYKFPTLEEVLKHIESIESTDFNQDTIEVFNVKSTVSIKRKWFVEEEKV